MQRLLRIFETVNTRVLMLVVVLFAIIIVAIAQMVGAWGTHSQPTYADRPAPFFAPPTSDSIINATALSTERLPDDDYNTVYAMSLKLMKSVATLTTTTSDMTAEGMAEIAALSEAQTVHQLQSSLAGRKLEGSTNPTLVSASDGAAEMDASVQYSATSSGSPATSTDVQMSFVRESGRWALANLNVQMSDTTVASGSGG